MFKPNLETKAKEVKELSKSSQYFGPYPQPEPKELWDPSKVPETPLSNPNSSWPGDHEDPKEQKVS